MTVRTAMAMAVMAAAVLAVAGCRPDPHPTLEMATTTSVQNSGLLDALLPAYREQTGIEVRVHAAGSGRALQMLADGFVDLVISHAPEAEARMLAAHPSWHRRPLAHNWFVIVGPPADPAGLREARDALDAVRRLAAGDAVFVSRGDGSGTHERELALWEAAGVRPRADRLIVSGRGMAQALRHADEAEGYTLTDEATFRQLEPGLDLVALVRDDQRLLNTYAVIYPEGRPPAARLARWLVEGDGRTRIGGFTIHGRPAFHLAPAMPANAGR